MKHAVAGLAALLVSSAAFALTLPLQVSSIDLASHLEFLEDPSGRLTLQDVVSGGDYVNRFRPWNGDQGSLNAGYTNSAYWVRFSLSRAPPAPSQWLLEVAYA